MCQNVAANPQNIRALAVHFATLLFIHYFNLFLRNTASVCHILAENVVSITKSTVVNSKSSAGKIEKNVHSKNQTCTCGYEPTLISNHEVSMPVKIARRIKYVARFGKLDPV